MSKFRNFVARHATKAAVASSVILASVGFESIAGATAYDPTTPLTNLASSATSTASPIMIAVTLALIPLFVVFMVVASIKGLFRRRH